MPNRTAVKRLLIIYVLGPRLRLRRMPWPFAYDEPATALCIPLLSHGKSYLAQRGASSAFSAQYCGRQASVAFMSVAVRVGGKGALLAFWWGFR